MRLVRLIANLGYGSRKEVMGLFRYGHITDSQGEVLYSDDQIEHSEIRIDGEPLDPPPGLTLMLHKPVNYTCSRKDQGALVYDLLPPRFAQRKPALSSVGRLDRDTSGLLLFTDDGQLLHRITSPKSGLAKIYRVRLSEDLRGDEGALFASGTLMLEGEQRPLLPAELLVTDSRSVRLTLHEGRYHQVRRMFAAVGNHVLELHREQVGGLTLAGLESGGWRVLETADQQQLFSCAV